MSPLQAQQITGLQTHQDSVFYTCGGITTIPPFTCPEIVYWTAPRLTEELAAHNRDDAYSPQEGASLLSQGAILLSTEHDVLC